VINLIEYIWIDDKSSIVDQITDNFSSMAIIISPFIKMPDGWTQKQKSITDEHIYPEHKDVINSNFAV
jgi:hypothetical protein